MGIQAKGCLRIVSHATIEMLDCAKYDMLVFLCPSLGMFEKCFCARQHGGFDTS